MSEQSRQIDLIKSYFELFDSKTGHLVLNDIMEHSGFMSTPFSADPYENAFLAGKRDVFAYLLSRLNYDLTKLQEIMEQAKVHEENFSILDN